MSGPADLFMESWKAAVEEALSSAGLSMGDVEIDLCEIRAGREAYGDEYVDRWDHDRNDGVWIELVERTGTAIGVGRAVMTALGVLADRTRTHLMLCPIACAKSDGTHLPQDGLEAWYLRLGYRPILAGKGSAMQREPQIPVQ